MPQISVPPCLSADAGFGLMSSATRPLVPPLELVDGAGAGAPPVPVPVPSTTTTA